MFSKKTPIRILQKSTHPQTAVPTQESVKETKETIQSARINTAEQRLASMREQMRKIYAALPHRSAVSANLYHELIKLDTLIAAEEYDHKLTKKVLTLCEEQEEKLSAAQEAPRAKL